MEVALLVVLRYLSGGEYVMTSEVIKFVDAEAASVAEERIRQHYFSVGFSVTTKILGGVA